MQAQLEKNKALVRRYWEEVWNKVNLELIDEIYAPEMVDKRRNLKSFIPGWLKGFPDSRIAIEALIAENDLVVTRYSCQGAVHTGIWEFTLQGLSMAVPPTGKLVHDHGITIHRLADGKIVEDRVEWNTLEVAQQLGVVPTSG